MRCARLFVSLLFCSVAAALIASCGEFSSCEKTLSCETDAGDDSGGIVIPTDCVPANAPDLPGDGDDSNCDGIDGDKSGAVFVAPSGLDDHPGTMTLPVRTVQHAVDVAKQEGKDVYLCAATYPENVVIEGSALRLQGGYDCTNGWLSGARHAELAPETGIPLTISNSSETTTITRLRLVAPNATQLGESSMALFAAYVSDLVINDSELEAGSGADGTAGAAMSGAAQYLVAAAGASLPTVTCYTLEPSPVQCENVASGGAASSVITCSTGGSVQGGKGGNGGNYYADTPFQEGSPGTPTAGSTSGTSGTAGAVGTPGAPAKSGFGSVDATGYHPTNGGELGSNGAPGRSGTGGRGGNSRWEGPDPSFADSYYVGGGGGAGGVAGCGGLGGNPGGGGGASIAALLFATAATIDGSYFRTGAGGLGGMSSGGAPGQAGVAGGGGGTGTCGAEHCKGQSGGRGGTGGKGGAGGPGGGGPSVGVVSQGFKPLISGSVFELGAGGPGALTIEGSGTGNGADGLTAEVHLIDVNE